MASTDLSGAYPDRSDRNPVRGFYRWLILTPIILIMLLCCGQAALLRSYQASANTRSMLASDYKPWPYMMLVPLDATAIVVDLQKGDEGHQKPLPVSTLPTSNFWPTTTSAPYPSQTPDAPSTTSVPSATLPPTRAVTVYLSPTVTKLLPTTPPSATASATSTVTASETATRRPPIIPTFTATEEEKPPEWTVTPNPTLLPTATPVPATPENTQTATVTVTSTMTLTQAPTPTDTATSAATSTPTTTETLTPTATVLPTDTETATLEPTPTETFTPPPIITPLDGRIHPILERGGQTFVVNENTCGAWFGYLNNNVDAVTIPIGGSNQLSPAPDLITPAQPTVFAPGRVVDAFYVEWSSKSPLVWRLNSGTATAGWCQ